ncbi:MAG: DUF2281 domain-containing protein [Chloroflexi bacterium]|jgi:hypothetical protein|nr:DUF2281 domain-containing protein [Chloroflexota bacterium]
MRETTTDVPVNSLIEMIVSLPPELQREVQEFVEVLHQRYTRRIEPLRLDWRGALRDLREKYTSVELQHQIRDWWAGVSS